MIRFQSLSHIVVATLGWILTKKRKEKIIQAILNQEQLNGANSCSNLKLAEFYESPASFAEITPWDSNTAATRKIKASLWGAAINCTPKGKS